MATISELVDEANSLVDQLLSSDKITPEVLNELADLEDKLANRTRRLVGRTGLIHRKAVELLDYAKQIIGATYDVIQNIHSEGLIAVSRKAFGIVRSTLGEVISVDFTGDRGLSSESLKQIASDTLTMNKTNEEWWATQADDLRQRFTTQVRLGMLQNENLEGMIKRVRGTSTENFTDGIMSVSRAQAEALVRTSVVNVGNAARLETFTKSDDLVTGIQWISTIDDRTTVICRELDHLKWKLPDYEPIGHNHEFPGPTAHWNCRSVQIPILRKLGQ